MSLLWVPRGHVALASSVVLVGTFTECGPIYGFCVLVTVVSLTELSTSTPHPRRRPELESPEYCTRFNILPSDLTSSTPTSNTCALQVECRISFNLRIFSLDYSLNLNFYFVELWHFFSVATVYYGKNYRYLIEEMSSSTSNSACV